jgi:hypothetical protein
MEGKLTGKLIDHFRNKLPETLEEWRSKSIIQRDSGDEFVVIGLDLSKDRITLQKVGSIMKVTLSLSDLKRKVQTENEAWKFRI